MTDYPRFDQRPSPWDYQYDDDNADFELFDVASGDTVAILSPQDHGQVGVHSWPPDATHDDPATDLGSFDNPVDGANAGWDYAHTGEWQ